MGFEIGFWDWLTFGFMFLSVVFGVWAWVVFAGLPGRIALARNHPEAEAVKLMGWAGVFPTVYPWVQAFIWAYKPTEIIDIRRFPKEEAMAIDQQNALLRAEASPPPPKAGAAPVAGTQP